MKTGIQLIQVLDRELVKNSSFQNIEITADELTNCETMDSNGLSVVSVVVKATELTEEYAKQIISKMQQFQIKNLVADTRNFPSQEKEKLAEILKNAVESPDVHRAENELNICIENGYMNNGARCIRNGFTDVSELRNFVEELNQVTNSKIFGVAVNVGHANLFVMNIPEMITGLADLVKIVYFNDNDGVNDMHQMPFTFTTGRGALATDWYGVEKALYRINYEGYVIFDVEGTFANMPKPVIPQVLKVLYGIIEEQEYFAQGIENKLNQPGKKIILFGAGNMFVNYMRTWGEKYPPAFLVDNNPATWNTSKMGIEIKGPQAILEIPAEQRNVFICNMYYKEIKQQLEGMGIEAHRYEDKYV